jgi:hypothetical protein
MEDLCWIELEQNYINLTTINLHWYQPRPIISLKPSGYHEYTNAFFNTTKLCIQPTERNLFVLYDSQNKQKFFPGWSL